MAETEIRSAIVEHCRLMNRRGLNSGVSGNISMRSGADMLITPSGVDYDQMTPEMIARIPLSALDGAWEGPLKPSTEWRFHQAILRERAEMNAVVHAHPAHCTALAMARKPIPAAHYMVAIFGGYDVRCSGYATFGSQALSDRVMEALEDRKACLMANHGMIALGETLDKAMWRAVELESLAHQYILSLQIGGPVLLNDDEMKEAMGMIETYGLQD